MMKQSSYMLSKSLHYKFCTIEELSKILNKFDAYYRNGCTYFPQITIIPEIDAPTGYYTGLYHLTINVGCHNFNTEKDIDYILQIINRKIKETIKGLNEEEDKI